MDNQQKPNADDLNTDQFVLASEIPIIIVGTLGNLLTLFVLHRPVFIKKSFAVFLRALAFADTGVLWLGQGTIQIFNVGRTTMKMEWEYRVRVGFFALFSLASSWAVVLVTLERVIIVCKPEKAKVLCSKRKAIWAVVIMWVIWITSCTIFATTASSQAILKDSYEKFVTYVILYSMLPMLVILPCNILLIIRLQRATAARRRLIPGAAYINTIPTDKATVMLITNSFVFVFMTSFEIIVLIVNITADVPLVVLQLAGCITKSNHAINFILYCVSGATFRKELKQMFQSILFCKQKRPEPLPSPGVNTISSMVHMPAFSFGSDMTENEAHNVTGL